MARNTESYWEKRSTELMKKIENGTEKTINSLISAYEKATTNINNEIKKIYNKYAAENKLTEKEALTLLSHSETDKFYKDLLEKINTVTDDDIKQKLIAKYNAPAYAYRISRYQALQDNIDVELKKLASIENELTKIRYVDTITEGYYRTIYDIQKKLGIGFNFSQIDKKTIELLLNNNWTNKANYSNRIWDNSEKLSEYLNTSLIADSLSGKSIQKMSRELNEAMNAGLFNSTRLIRTETNYFANQSELLSYEECGIEEYQFIATLDKVTCSHCAKLDKKIFKVKEAKPGKNCPPIHPNDRCTTVAYFGEEDEELQRIARDPKDNKNYYINNMSYTDWKKQYGENTIDKYHKMYTNERRDKVQYENYVNTLGKIRNLETFAKFQELKYNNIIEYKSLTYEYDLKNHYDYAISNGHLSPLISFDTYKNIDIGIELELVGLKTTNQMEIKSYSKHFIDRVCGSIEQRRSGVKIKDIKDVLLNSKNYRELDESIVFYNNYIQVSVNKINGNLIQTNPRSRRKNK